jgi:general secretion pathway protein H
VSSPAAFRHQGFTLIEVMVVLVLISIIVSFAVLSVDTGPEELRREGSRLASLLELASEEAVMNGREYRLILTRRGYSFEQLREGEWLAVEDEILRPRELPAFMTLSFILENEPLPLPESTGDDQKKPPVILLLSSGELPPFELTVTTDNGSVMLISTREGRVETSSPQ